MLQALVALPSRSTVTEKREEAVQGEGRRRRRRRSLRNNQKDRSELVCRGLSEDQTGLALVHWARPCGSHLRVCARHVAPKVKLHMRGSRKQAT